MSQPQGFCFGHLVFPLPESLLFLIPPWFFSTSFRILLKWFSSDSSFLRILSEIAFLYYSLSSYWFFLHSFCYYPTLLMCFFPFLSFCDQYITSLRVGLPLFCSLLNPQHQELCLPCRRHLKNLSNDSRFGSLFSVTNVVGWELLFCQLSLFRKISWLASSDGMAKVPWKNE